MANCCTKLGKVIFILLNIIYLLIGLGVLVVGVGVLAIRFPTQLVTGINNTTVLPIVLIVCGVIIFVLAILGIVGAANNIWILVLIYSMCMVILVVLQGVGIGVMMSQQHDLDFDKQKLLNEIMTDIQIYNTDTSAKLVVDVIQEMCTCCGVNGSSDWILYNQGIPQSCQCNTMETECDEGCKDTVYGCAHRNIKIAGGAGIFLAFIQCLYACLGFCLCGCLMSERRGRYQRVITTIEPEDERTRLTVNNTTTNTHGVAQPHNEERPPPYNYEYHN